MNGLICTKQKPTYYAPPKSLPCNFLWTSYKVVAFQLLPSFGSSLSYRCTVHTQTLAKRRKQAVTNPHGYLPTKLHSLYIMTGLLSHRATICFNKRLWFVQYRQLSSRTSPLQSTYASEQPPAEAIQPLHLASNPPPTPGTMPKISPLSILPLSAVIRSLAIMSVSSSPVGSF